MITISDPAIRGSGLITGAFPSPNGKVLAVASAFPRLVNPYSRACYLGQTLHFRLALYRRGEPIPFAAFDHLRFPINDVAFHPKKPVVAIATGSYDGGYLFEGDLIFWNWIDNLHGKPFAQIPEVVRCYFDEAGENIEALVRPWDEEWEGLPDARPDAAFDSFFPVRSPYSAAAFSEAGTAVAELDPNTRMESSQIAEQGLGIIHISTDDDAEFRTLSWLGMPQRKMRAAIRDLEWLDDDRLAVVHDGCLLEIFNMSGELAKAFHGEGYGCEILKSDPVCIHIVNSSVSARGHRHGIGFAKLCALSDDALIEIGSFEGEYTFSSAVDGMILGRLNRIPAGKSNKDLLIDLNDVKAVRQVDLGHYDCFNHYIGIDGAPYLFLLQGTPPSSHMKKRLCIVRPSGKVKALWPLLTPDGTSASHAMECCGCFISDSSGEGVAISGRHYEPNPSKPVSAFVYRKQLGADREIWRHATESCASAMVFMPDAGLIVAALLDGTLLVIGAATGAVVLEAKARIDGVRTVIFALDVHGDRLALGTIDGRIVVVGIDKLLNDDRGAGWLDLC